jgi:hypothetical protein
MKQAEADGHVEHTVDTSKPGHPHMWRITEAGRTAHESDPRTFEDVLTNLQARRAYSLMRRHGISERRAIAAVTKRWGSPDS